ncbi:unnamed protein product [Cercopithifilaria johnstoni]|uniref:Uncharacterized protein n=1 Tax=Cercopithifilaria johnstoni TaxID=2874296 RepID=A0A8J2Q6Q2_9BILA|nr:unnamed protein product [Cercopithifilaria johnstoni]
MQDPDAKEADTYYGMRSTVAFPIKGTTIERKDDFKVPQASADIESELGIKQPDIPDREVQSESTPVQEDSRPVGFSMQNFFQKCQSKFQ